MEFEERGTLEVTLFIEVTYILNTLKFYSVSRDWSILKRFLPFSFLSNPAMATHLGIFKATCVIQTF